MNHDRTLYLVQVTNLLFCTLVCQLLSVNLETPKLPELQPNWPFLTQVIVQITVILLYFFIEVYTPNFIVIRPSWPLAISVCLVLVVMLATNHKSTRIYQRKFKKD